MKIQLEIAQNRAVLECINSAGVWQGIFEYKEFKYPFQHEGEMTYDAWVDQGHIMLTNHIIWDIIRTKYPNRTRTYANLERQGHRYKATYEKYEANSVTSKLACKRLLNVIRL